MTAPDQQQVIADALAAHRWQRRHGGFVTCSCGGDWTDHRAHVAEAIAAALAASNAGTDPADGQATEGCDCAELCDMGPTCPGGMLARLPGSGCWRSHADGQAVAVGLSEDEREARDWLTDALDRGGLGGTMAEDERLAVVLSALDRLAARRGQDAERALAEVERRLGRLRIETEYGPHRRAGMEDALRIVREVRAAGGTP